MRKFESIDPVKLYATMKPSHWTDLLQNSISKRSSHNLLKWRYGLQAGLADANRNGKITTEKMDLWVIGRLKDLENAMKHILRAKYPNPMDNPSNNGIDIQARATVAKKKRDREFEMFLQKSNF